MAGSSFGDDTSVSGTLAVIEEQGSAPSAPAAGSGGILYTKADGKIYWISDDVSETDLTSGGGGTTINNATANELVTVASSTDELDAEANLTYDGTDLKATSSSTNKPIITIENTHNGGTAGYLKFNNTEAGGAGADNDVCGTITFYGQDDASSNIEFARIEGVVADASNGDECGALKLYAVENDGNPTVGLKIQGSTTDGEVDATIGAGTASVTTVAGDLKVTTNIILDDGGSITEAGGTAAITIDASGEITKLGQDTPAADQVLTWDNSNSKVIWATTGASGQIVFDDGPRMPYAAISSATTLTAAHHIVQCDPSSAAFTITLTAANTLGAGKVFVIKNATTSTNAITVDGNGSETIDGDTTYAMTIPYGSITIYTDGSNWFII